MFVKCRILNLFSMVAPLSVANYGERDCSRCAFSWYDLIRREEDNSLIFPATVERHKEDEEKWRQLKPTTPMERLRQHLLPQQCHLSSLTWTRHCILPKNLEHVHNFWMIRKNVCEHRANIFGIFNEPWKKQQQKKHSLAAQRLRSMRHHLSRNPPQTRNF